MKFGTMTLFYASCILSTAGVAAAQTPCANGDPLANLGFSYAAVANASGMSVYDTRGSAGQSTVSFRDEPRIANIDPTGPASSLREGDRIARVNGLSVTTPEGTAALRGARVGRSIILTVRRDDKLIPVTVVPNKTYCPSAREVLPSRTPSRQAEWSASTRTLQRTPAVTAGTMVQGGAGWLGIGFDCTDCSLRQTPTGRVWFFSEPPTIYNVDTGSPAHAAGLRRGDVLLKVNGQDVQSLAARTRLGQVKPGETLRLAYRRGQRTAEATLRVALNPVAAARAGGAASAAPSGARAGQGVRATEPSNAIREMMTRVERSRAEEQAVISSLEKSLQNVNSTDAAALARTRAAIARLRSQHEASSREQEKLLSEVLRAQSAQSSLEEVVVTGRALGTQVYTSGGYGMVVDSIVNGRPMGRLTQLRYSGSVGDANVEVRGPGSISVQGDDRDLVIVTGDAVIRITNRKPR
jgi:membrane-associated protease RseP (regulator of RpoE activity)